MSLYPVLSSAKKKNVSTIIWSQAQRFRTKGQHQVNRTNEVPFLINLTKFLDPGD